jgi:hypothetical protein
MVSPSHQIIRLPPQGLNSALLANQNEEGPQVLRAFFNGVK